jgi:hypothetical protein
MESIADEEYYRDFALAVTSDPSGRHIVKVNITPNPPTFLSYTILNHRGHRVSHRDGEAKPRSRCVTRPSTLGGCVTASYWA